MQLQKFNIKDNINLYYTPTKKFKTTTIGFYIQRPLLREECTKNSLLSMLMRRACKSYPNSQDLSRYLDELYGVSYSTAVRKTGERQIICANFQFINEKFLEERPSILSNVLDLAYELVLNQKSFSDEYIAQEKENLRLQILSAINDKRQYALKRCIEIMCEGENYGISNTGYTEDIDGIDASTLYTHYKNVVLKSPVDIFVQGDVDILYITEKLQNMFLDIEVSNTKFLPFGVKKDVSNVKNKEEEQPVSQGKLSMGFRTNVFSTDEDYPALMMYNAILGGGIFSKLFNNVREKYSLCYYASSAVDYLKGVMTINSGIEVENFKKAYDEILVQMDDIRKGNISDMEMSAAVLGTVNSINSISDSPLSLHHFYLSKIVSGKIITPDELADKIRLVTK